MERRPTVALIDTQALKFNYRQIIEKVPSTTKMMAVVKANAYGHGDIGVSKTLEEAGCGCFGVAVVEEGIRLRQGGIKSPVVILGGIYAGQITELFDFDLTPVIFDLDSADVINRAAGPGSIKDVHIKIDTGMGRLGVLPKGIEAFFKKLKTFGNIRVQGLLSHFSESENEDMVFSKKQIEVFNKCVGKIRELGFNPELIHMANSAAVVNFPESHFNLVRPGIMLYGSYPSEVLREKIELKPVMKISTRPLHVKKVPAGFPVSYGRTFVTKVDSLIATLPLGYGDGLPRRLSARGEVLIKGKRVPIAGLVCMDLTMADVTTVEGSCSSEEVVIMGSQGEDCITVEEIARKAGTISYEIFCNISSRVPRVYL